MYRIGSAIKYVLGILTVLRNNLKQFNFLLKMKCQIQNNVTKDLHVWFSFMSLLLRFY